MGILNGFKKTFGLGFSLASYDFKLRNEGSYLGIFWYLLNPILLFALLLFVFSQNLGIAIENYPLYLLIGIIMFNFFSSTVMGSTKTIIENAGIIKAMNFPRESLILAKVLRVVFSHVFEIIILVVILLFFDFSIKWVLFYPIILLFFVLFVLGFSFLLSSLTVYFIDLDNVWAFASSLFWFGTPIFYAIEKGTMLYYFNLLNPLYYFIIITREFLIYNRFPELWMILIAGIFGLSFLIIGLFLFSKLKFKFAELI